MPRGMTFGISLVGSLLGVSSKDAIFNQDQWHELDLVKYLIWDECIVYGNNVLQKVVKYVLKGSTCRKL